MRQLTVIALMLALFCGISVQAQGLDIGGPLFECRPSWDFGGGGVQAHFSKGQLTGVVSQPPRFEVSPYCGGSSLTISFSAFVKNVSMRVAAGGGSAVRVLGSSATVNPGGSGTIVTLAGPTSFLYLWNIGEGSVLVDRISFELAEQPALFSFGATTTGRVLTHKYRDDDAYPSAKQTEDRKILVEGLVHDLTGTNGISGRKAYFRLIDPPDTADYTKKNGDAKPGDNADGPGTLSTASAVSDSNGKVSVTLGITDHAAGDNYQIEAALDPEFKCAPAPCQKSIVYTAWKRVYVEMHKMFKVGSFIVRPVQPDDKKIFVESVKGFPEPPFTVRLIHASGVEDPASDFYFENLRIVAWQQKKEGTELVMEGADDPGIPGVVNAYTAEEKVRNIIRPYLRDAVGVITGDRSRDYFLTNGMFVNRTFEDAFVEHLWLTDSVAGTDKDLLATQPRIAFDGAIPFRATRIGDSGDSEREWLTRKWLRNAARSKTEERSARPNHQALFIAAKHQFSDTKKSLWSIGITTVADDFNDAWVFVEETGMGNNNFRGEATVHELAHQWLVNPTTSKGTAASGHCDTALPDPYQLMYNQHSLKCTMTSDVSKPSNQEASDGIVGFHYNVKVGQPRDSEYLRIRRRPEPVPQNEKTGRILK